MSHKATEWAWAQEVLQPDGKTDPLAKFVLMALADFANKDTNEAWPSSATLAEKTGMSRSTVVAKLRVLEAAGLIKTVPRRTGAENLSNLYVLPVGQAGSPGVIRQPDNPPCAADGGAPWGYPGDGQPPERRPDAAPVRLADEGYPAAGHEPVIEPVTEKKEEKRDARAAAIGFDFEACEFRGLTESHFLRWRVEFPAIDVRLAVHQAGVWLVANDTARTRRMSASRFLAKWLSRAQDRAPRVDCAAGRPLPREQRGAASDERADWLMRCTGRAAPRAVAAPDAWAAAA